MNLIAYDIGLLIIFVIFVTLFLYKNKKNLKKEGLLYIYRTSWGMKIIDKIGQKYKKTLKFLSYVSITIGYALMAGMIYMVGKIVYVYVAYPAIVQELKVPPIMPLLPYMPQAFQLDFLPPFYFSYFIIILAVIAIPHEFAHGIFMRRYGINIKSTGFGFFPFFLPIFLAAFVEQDEKDMEKKSSFKQMSVLSAGTFANIIITIIGFILMALFFILAFSPAGVEFDSYAYTVTGLSAINMVNNQTFDNHTYESLNNSLEDGLNTVRVNQTEYYLTKDFLDKQRNAQDYVLVYYKAPAIENNISNVITSINGETIKSMDKMNSVLDPYNPGDEINVTLARGENNDRITYKEKLVLGENPINNSEPWLGITFQKQNQGAMGKLISFFNFKKPYVNYQPNFGAGVFIYQLLWWVVLASFSVALVNMLPVGIFDGGRFFYLTIFSLTKSEKKAANWFKFSTNLILFILVLLMVFWVIGIL